MNALSGSLAHFQLVQVLRLLQMVSATGRLSVEHAGEQADLFLQDGRRLFARTNGVSVRTGDLLVHRGQLRPEAVDLMAAMQRDRPGQRLGQMLVDSGAVDTAEVREAVLNVQRRIVCRVLLWREGEFVFAPGDVQANHEQIAIDLDVDEIIGLAMRTADELHADDREDRAA